MQKLDLTYRHFMHSLFEQHVLKGDTLFHLIVHQLNGNGGFLIEVGFMGISGSGRTRSNFWEGKSEKFPRKKRRFGEKIMEICLFTIGTKMAKVKN